MGIIEDVTIFFFIILVGLISIGVGKILLFLDYNNLYSLIFGYILIVLGFFVILSAILAEAIMLKSRR